MTTLYTSDKHLLSWDVFLVFELGTWGTFIRMGPLYMAPSYMALLHMAPSGDNYLL